MKRNITVTPLTASMFCSKIAAAHNATILADYRSAQRFPKPDAAAQARVLNFTIPQIPPMNLPFAALRLAS